MELINDDAERGVFGRVLLRTAAAGFIAMAAGFVAYVLGWLPSHIPVERMPEVWSQPAAARLRGEGLAQGWGWILHAGEGEFAALLPIAWLATCSALALAAALRVYLRRGDGVYVALCLLQLAILSVAASGLFSLRI